MTKEIEQAAFFKGEKIRKTIHNKEWWFVVRDVVLVLTETKDAKDYIKKIRARDKGVFQAWGQIVTPLQFLTKGGRQNINCANVEGIFRIIQSISSPKVEPFKRWLTKVGNKKC